MSELFEVVGAGIYDHARDVVIWADTGVTMADLQAYLDRLASLTPEVTPYENPRARREPVETLKELAR